MLPKFLENSSTIFLQILWNFVQFLLSSPKITFQISLSFHQNILKVFPKCFLYFFQSFLRFLRSFPQFLWNFKNAFQFFVSSPKIAVKILQSFHNILKVCRKCFLYLFFKVFLQFFPGFPLPPYLFTVISEIFSNHFQNCSKN